MSNTEKTQQYRKEVIDLYESSKGQIIFELKKDLNSENKNIFLISMLSSVLDERELESLKKLLTFDEIQSFNQCIDASIQLSAESLKKFSLQLKKLLLFSKPDISEDSVIKLEKMTLEHLKRFLDMNKDLMSLCLSILSPAKLTTLLNELNADEVENIFSTQTSFSSTSDIKTLEEKIRQYQVEPTIPFTKALSASLSNLSIEKEKTIYAKLFEQNQLDLIKNAAIQSIPAEIIEKLPLEQIRDSMQGVDAQTHATYLSLLPANKQMNWLSVICDEGSKLSTMLKMEISSIQENKKLFEKIENKAQQIKLEYLKQIREYFARPEQKDLVTPIIEQWISDNKIVT